MENPIVLNVMYTIAEGKTEEFYKKINELGVPQQTRLENGNIRYEYYFPAESHNQMLLIEEWKDQACLNAHKETSHFKKLQVIKESYVVNISVESYTVKNNT